MFKRNKSYIATISIIGLIAILSFADTGIFVRNFLATAKDGNKANFKDGEKANIVREVGKGYIVEKDSVGYLVPKENILPATKEEVVYKVVKDKTPLLNIPSPYSNVLKNLKMNDIVYLEKKIGDYGLYNTGKEKGYILNSHLKKATRENKLLTYAVSSSNKVLKNNNKYYVLLKGDKVPIKGYKNQNFIVVDENGNEFKAPSKYINLGKSNSIASRGARVSKRTSNLNKVITNAHSALGRPYVRAGTGKRGYDCSGLSYSVYKKGANVKLPRTSRAQSKAGKFVKKSQLVPGDLVFFNTSGRGVSHVGIYIGDNKMIHASSGSRKVRFDNLDSRYYKKRYVTGRRILH